LGLGGHKKLITICGKLAAGNLANRPAEFGKICCRKLWSLVIIIIIIIIIITTTTIIK